MYKSKIMRLEAIQQFHFRDFIIALPTHIFSDFIELSDNCEWITRTFLKHIVVNRYQGRINLFVGPRHNILCGPSSVAKQEIYGVGAHIVGRKPAEGEQKVCSKLAVDVDKFKRMSDNSI